MPPELAGLRAGQGYRLVSFDLDGTLVDTAVEIVEACNRALADFDVPPQPHDVVVASIGNGTRELVMQQLAQVLLADPGRAGRMPFEAVYARFQHHYGITSGTIGVPFPGCIDALEMLQAAGVRCVCVTNKEERFARQVVEGNSLSRYFDLLIGGDTLGFKKPDARVMAHVLNRIGVPSRHAGHVGDSSIDVNTARNAGISAWAVPYGYNGGVPVCESLPDRLYERLDHLAADIVSGCLLPRMADAEPAAIHPSIRY